MFREMIDSFGRRKFDKNEEIAPAAVRKLDDILFQHEEDRPSDGAGTLDIDSPMHERWKEVERIADEEDMDAKEYNQLLFKVYGSWDSKRDDLIRAVDLPKGKLCD